MRVLRQAGRRTLLQGQAWVGSGLELSPLPLGRQAVEDACLTAKYLAPLLAPLLAPELA